MICGSGVKTWAGVDWPSEGHDDGCPAENSGIVVGRPAEDELVCATDPFDDFDDDDFDDEFDDDFEEEWDEDLPGDADQFEPDEVEEKEEELPVDPEFEDED
jgi:hypothetical protein